MDERARTHGRPLHRRRHARLTIVGFDPHRSYRRRRSDYVLVAAAVVVVAALLLWALLA